MQGELDSSLIKRRALKELAKAVVDDDDDDDDDDWGLGEVGGEFEVQTPQVSEDEESVRQN